jgi:hypothetical protein
VQVAASFIEYLVTGFVSIIWLLPLLQRTGIPLEVGAGASALLALPLLYALGMLIDYLSYRVLRPLKDRLNYRFDRRYPELAPSISPFPSRTALIEALSPELGRELSMRSTRDRIARGCVVNSGFLFVVAATGWASESQGWEFVPHGIAVAGIALILAIWSYLTWLEFEERTRYFKLSAVRTLVELGRLGNIASRGDQSNSDAGHGMGEG